MAEEMATQNWQIVTGLGFAIVLVIFFMAAWFFPPKSQSNDNILRILAAVFAGATGAFLTGGLTIQVEGQISTAMNVAVSAAGGAALFLLVWMTWKQKLGAGFNITIPASTAFEAAAKLISATESKTCIFDGFSHEQRSAIASDEMVIRQQSPQKALEILWQYFPTDALPKYGVGETDTGWKIKKNN